MKKVAIAISLLHASSRDFLSGVFHQIEAGVDWNLKIWQSEENPPTPEKLAKAERDGLDGVILTEPGSEAFAAALAASAVPVVLVGCRPQAFLERRAPTVFIRSDSAGIGVLGARHLYGLGRFNAFGFVPTTPDADWSEERRAAFVRELAVRGVPAETFRRDLEPGSDEDLAELAGWLSALKKPAAVMAACDWRAVQTLAACEQAQIKVPDQVALLGVDNDELVCLHTTPPLSSIIPGHEEIGVATARALERLMRCRRRVRTDGERTTFAATRPSLVARGSTTVVPPAAHLVERAKRFIRENACKGIGVGDVVSHMRVSRRLLELRMHNIEGRTIRELIESARLATLKRLLATTTRPLATLAKECGFSDANVLAHLFKKRVGLSMRAYRAQARAARKARHKA